LTKFKGIALDMLFPRWCFDCGREGGFICSDCLKSLPRINPPLCPHYGRPQLDVLVYPVCVGWPASTNSIYAQFKFDGAIRQTIHDLKYKNLGSTAALLGQWLGD